MNWHSICSLRSPIVRFVSSFPPGVTPITLYMTNTSPLQISEQTIVLQTQLSSSSSEPGITESPVEATASESVTATEPMFTEQPSVKISPSSSVNTDVAMSRRDKLLDTSSQKFSEATPSIIEANVAALGGFSASAQSFAESQQQPSSDIGSRSIVSEASPLSESQFPASSLVTDPQSLEKRAVPAVSGAGCENSTTGVCEFRPKPSSEKYATILTKHVGSFSSNDVQPSAVPSKDTGRWS